MSKYTEVVTSIVVPAFNEAEIIFDQLDFFVALWRSSGLGSFEVVVVENGSQDMTWKEVQRLSEKYSEVRGIRLPRSSYGLALRCGLLSARGQNIICIDVDYYDIVYIKKSLRWLHYRSGYVVGSKLDPNSVDSRGESRLITTRLLNTLIRFIFKYPGTDTHGLKSFTNDGLFQTCVRRCVSRDELFDTELLIRLQKEKLPWTELPVQVREIRQSRSSLLKRMRRAVVDFCRIILSWMTGGLAPKGQLPIVADDYGWSRRHDQLMVREIENGVERVAVSVLANMASKRSLEYLHHFSTSRLLPVSLHFNLVEGKPISSLLDVPSLVDKNGNFYGLFRFFGRLVCGKISLDEVMLELVAQYDYLSHYVRITHLDSHQHVHLLAPISRIILNFTRTHKSVCIRSCWSSMNYLGRKPLRLMGLILLTTMSDFCFGRSIGDVAVQDELIFHPGFSYDE